MQHSSRFILATLATLSAFFTFAAYAPAATKEAVVKPPTGIGKAEFGMSPAKVEKLYGGKVRVLGQENLGAATVTSPFIVRQALSDQKVPGLKEPVTVELRYWKDKLWVAIVYYGQNSVEAVNEGLRQAYGKPTVAANDTVWNFPKTMVNTSNRERWYAISDTAISREAQAAFMEDMRKAQQRGQPPASAPAANPATP